MPRATVNLDSVRRDLKTLPGAFVELRTMSYGEYLHRRDLALKMSMEGRDTKNSKVLIDTVQEAVAAYELKTCVVDHNLEDESGRKLQLGNPMDFRRLDPRVGQEIGNYIDELNKFDEDDMFPENPASDSSGQEG